MIFSRNFKAMDCDCEVRIECQTAAGADRSLALVLAEIERIEAKYSTRRKHSHWQQLVAKASAGSSVAVDDETARLLDMAELGHTVSEGLYDVTLSALLEIWDWHAASLPRSSEIADAMSTSGWSRVGWQAPMLMLPDIGMKMDLGGLIKEYSADSCIEVLQEHGFGTALVALGGDVAACVEDDACQPWQVDIKPSHALGKEPVRVQMRSGGMATRGDFDRCMVIDGIRYSHLLDPRNGWPVQGLASVSVVAPQCVTAGIFATTAMVRGPERGPVWLQQMQIEYLCTDSAGRQSGPLQSPEERDSGVA